MKKRKIARFILCLAIIPMISFNLGVPAKHLDAIVEAPEHVEAETKAKVTAASTKKTVPKPITLTFTGDVLLDRSVGESIRTKGVDYPFQYVSPLLKKADLTFVNLETAVSIRGKAQNKQFTFRSKPETLKGLVNAGVDGVSLANNHTMDYGTLGLTDTIYYLQKAKLGFTGAGKNKEQAFSAYYKTVNGKKIAILGLSRVLPDGSWFANGSKPGIAHAYSKEPMMSYVKKAVKNSDYTVIMIHWNRERQNYPEAYAKEMAKDFINAGVDAVIGSHSHSLMGIEYYKGRPIYYSLGNFIFTNSSDPRGSETMIVNLTINNNRVSSSLTPAKIVNGQPKLMNQSYNKSIINKLNQLSTNVKIDTNGNVKLK